MGDLSRNFSRDEFACRCGCGFDTVDADLLDLNQAIRSHFGMMVKVLSGCRCAAHNKNVGGADNSQHRLGRADDIVVVGVPPEAVADFAEQWLGKSGGVGRYENFTHVDTRTDGPARWATVNPEEV